MTSQILLSGVTGNILEWAFEYIPTLTIAIILIIGLLRIGIVIGGSMKELKHMIHGIDSRFNGIDSKLNGIDSRFDKIEINFSKMNSKIDNVESKLLTEIKQSETKLSNDLKEVKKDLSQRIDGVEKNLSDRIDRTNIRFDQVLLHLGSKPKMNIEKD